MGAGKKEDTGGRMKDFPGWSHRFSAGPANLQVDDGKGGQEVEEMVAELKKVAFCSPGRN